MFYFGLPRQFQGLKTTWSSTTMRGSSIWSFPRINEADRNFIFFRQVSVCFWENSLATFISHFKTSNFYDVTTTSKENSETISLNGANFSHNELVNFPTNFGVKFTISIPSLRSDWHWLCNEIAKFVASFENLKRTSKTIGQKFCETHCNLMSY